MFQVGLFPIFDSVHSRPALLSARLPGWAFISFVLAYASHSLHIFLWNYSRILLFNGIH
jgi:hypothetical protein